MSKRSRKGFYIDGQFMTRPPETEAGPPSRTARKIASAELQALGERLIAAKPRLVKDLPVPERLKDAIAAALSISSPGAARRQRQYIGKLMRALDDDDVAAIRAALDLAD
jgi:ribosome-associated protein